MKTPSEKKEYNRLKAKESRERKKALGLPLNNPEVQKKAIEKFKSKKPRLDIHINHEILEKFDKKAKSLNMTREQLFNKMYFDFFGKENIESI